LCRKFEYTRQEIHCHRKDKEYSAKELWRRKDSWFLLDRDSGKWRPGNVVVVKGEKQKRWVRVFGSHFHMNQIWRVVIRNDVIILFFVIPRRSWKPKELEFFQLCDQIFNDIPFPKTFIVEIT